MKQVLLSLFLYFLKQYSSLCRLFLSKNSKLVLFGAMKGAYYGDNSRHLYEWVLKNRPDLKAVWLTSQPQILKRLKAEGKPVVLQRSMRAVRLLAKAKVAVFTNSLNDLAIKASFIPNSLRLIALRHGRSVKRVRFARRGDKISFTEATARKHEGTLIKYAISTSEFISDVQEECLKIGRKKHLVTGYPRNDALLNISEKVFKKWKIFINGSKFDRVFLYGPSWRHGRERTQFFPFPDFDRDKLVDFLEKTRTILLLRPHVNDLVYRRTKRFLESLINSSEMIKLATHREIQDVNMLLPFVDVLISDYSALYHDFLLLDRPLMFIPYDYKEFARQNGFLYDYYTNLPGPAITTFKEFIDQSKLLIEGRDPQKQSRHALCRRIHTYQDGNSCSRVVKVIEDLLSE